MEEKIKQLVLDLYGISITPETKISDVVEDSLTAIDFLFEVEQKIGYSISYEEILDGISTFGDFIKALDSD